MLLSSTSKDGGIGVDRTTLAGRTADKVRELILVETLKPGAVLAERDLSAQLGVSRTPLREALRILATEGLVEMSPNLRPRVANPSLDQLMSLLDVLSALERLACEIAAEKRDPELFENLNGLVEQMRNSPDEGDPLEFFKIDMKFHSAIVEHSENPPLITTHGQYNSAVYRARFMSTQWIARRPIMHDQHSAIANLLESGDGMAAAELMRAHFRQTAINVREMYQAKQT